MEEKQKEEFETKDLYGGAITCIIPTRFFDVSKIRQVPDHQEVFTDIDTDASLIIELNSRVASSSDEEAAKVHFEQLAEDNCAPSSSVLTLERIPQEHLPHFDQNVPKFFLLGQQDIAKFKEDAFNKVNIYMALIRLVGVGTDVLITLNEPVHVDSRSSSFQNISLASDKERNSALAVFLQVLKSFEIKNWNLFC
eukprot:CAMPEP_0174262218 /NCGR_PEP_ID=MMETSP0439-20130205/12845_1 /TAXON_ID=0 /ORGANISM="Stereomyxa ramosa, Strain Chinc5" /LENGTH=194 /DNA_ID=CAMNT_0015346891 /DNA_START=208 /DNA_END=792 /DNA_ORIENTATION=-